MVSMEKRTTIRLNEETIRILILAEQIWSEHAENHSALIRTIISDWWRNRQENGSKSQKIIERIDLAEQRIIAEISCACRAAQAGGENTDVP